MAETGSAAELIQQAFGTPRSEAAWPVRVRGALDRFLRALAAEQDLAWTVMVEQPSRGPEARRRYREALNPILSLLAEGRELAANRTELPAEVEQMAISAAESVVVDELVAGRAEMLPEMLPEILFTVLVPYLGQKGAAAAMYRAREGAAAA